MARGKASPLVERLRHDFPELNEPETVIRSGRVTVDRVIRMNPAFRVPGNAHVSVAGELTLRGEAKLRAAIERFEVPVTGRIALDVGASAGGFTRVLLEQGASRVYAVDAGHGQLLGSLRRDPRVVNLEGTNLGVLSPALVPDPIDLLTVDVSYLSLSAAVAQLNQITLAPDAQLIGLVKPMFELRLATAPADAPGDEARVQESLQRAVEGVTSAGWQVEGWMHSPVRGAHGARELLLSARRRVSGSEDSVGRDGA